MASIFLDDIRYSVFLTYLHLIMSSDFESFRCQKVKLEQKLIQLSAVVSVLRAFTAVDRVLGYCSPIKGLLKEKCH